VLILQVLDTLLVGVGLGYEARLAAMGLLILLWTTARPLTRQLAAAGWRLRSRVS
jgi:hypothetical protein